MFFFLEIHSETEFWMPKEHGALVISNTVSAAEMPPVRRDQGLPCDGCSHFHFTGHSWAQQQLLMITYYKKGKKHWTGRSLGGKGGGIVVNKSANNKVGEGKKTTTSSHTVAYGGPHIRAIGNSCGQYSALWEEKSSKQRSVVYWLLPALLEALTVSTVIKRRRGQESEEKEWVWEKGKYCFNAYIFSPCCTNQ